MSNVVDIEDFKARAITKLHGEAVFGTISIVDGAIRISVQGDYAPGAAEALARQLYNFAAQIREEQAHGR